MKVTKKDIRKANKKASREIELAASTKGWNSTHSVHKSMKTYSRKKKHKNLELSD